MLSKENVWDLLKKDLIEFSGSECGNANDQQIQDIEKKIHLKINKQFKYFLKNHECESIGELLIYTINKADFSSKNYSLIYAHGKYKIEDEWPDIEDWLIISDDGSGNPIGILPNGEIWTSDHNNGFKKYKLANDFEEFVYKLLTETLWDD